MGPRSNCRKCGPAWAAAIASCPTERAWCTCPVVGGRVPLLGVRPDGTPVELPDVRAGLVGGHRFLRNGTGLVYLPRSQSRDFWLLDLATKKIRALTRLSDHGVLHAFDITPDGKSIVFDRLQQNSDIVLIDLPK